MKLMALIQDDTIDFKERLEIANKVIAYCEAGGSETDPFIKESYMYLLDVKNKE